MFLDQTKERKANLKALSDLWFEHEGPEVRVVLNHSATEQQLLTKRVVMSLFVLS